MMDCFYLYAIWIHILLTNVLLGNIAVLIAYLIRHSASNNNLKADLVPLIPFLLIISIPALAHYTLNNMGYTSLVMCEIDNKIINFINQLFS